MATSLIFFSSLSTYACSQDDAKKAVETVCKEIEANADKAKDFIQSFRFCDSNYVWVQDSDVKMVVHPIKGRLNGQSLKENKDEKGKLLFIEFDKEAKSKKDGGWVDYMWTKPGDESPTPKISYVKLCGGDKKWIAGAGVWK